MINWEKATKEEYELFKQIADREVKEGICYSTDRMSILMDIEAAHATYPLKLKELLNAPVVDFAHDIYGIAANLNRNTGELENYFIPRYAK